MISIDIYDEDYQAIMHYVEDEYNPDNEGNYPEFADRLHILLNDKLKF